MSQTLTSRNALCPCGSGRKFKVCCLRARTGHTAALHPPGRVMAHVLTPLTRGQSTRRPFDPHEWCEVEVALDVPTGATYVAVLMHSREWMRVKKFTIGSPFPLNIPQCRVRGQGRVRSIRPTHETADGEGLVLRIDREEKPDDLGLPPVAQRAWQQVHVRLDEPDGKRVYAVLLHSREWLARQGFRSGGEFPLALPQQKVRGTGRVALIEPSPLKSDGEGRVMTFVRSTRKPGDEPNADPLARPGVRTYFGERMPPVGHGWLEMVLAQDGQQKSDLRFTRSDEWLRAFRQAVGEQPDLPECLPADVAEWRLVRVTVAVQQKQKAHIVFFLPKRVVEERALTAGESVLLRLPKDHLSGEGKLTAIEPAPFVPGGDEPMGRMFISGKRGSQGKGTIDTTEVGDYVTTYTHEERRDRLPVDDTQGKWVARMRVRLHMDKGEAGHSKIMFLRDDEWFRSEQVVVGGVVHLNMPEMGCVGHAKVEAVEPCLVFYRWGNSSVRMVTGTFAHSEGECGDLRLKGEPEPIGVTPSHPFWSADREDWVPVEDLRAGESVKTLQGTTTVESYTLRARPEPTFNMEVEDDHVYRVGEQGILVHNASAGECGKRFEDMASWVDRGNALRSEVLHIHRGYPDNANRDSKTTSVALIQLPDCGWQCVYAVSGGRRKRVNDPDDGPFTGADPIPPLGVRSRADTLGYRLIRGAGPHAEQKILASLPPGAILLAIASCRPACTEETTNRVEGTCSNDIHLRGHLQGVAVMLFEPLGGPPYCT